MGRQGGGGQRPRGPHLAACATTSTRVVGVQNCTETVARSGPSTGDRVQALLRQSNQPPAVNRSRQTPSTDTSIPELSWVLHGCDPPTSPIAPSRRASSAWARKVPRCVAHEHARITWRPATTATDVHVCLWSVPSSNFSIKLIHKQNY